MAMIRLKMPSRLETERLYLQRLRYEDAEEMFYAYASKPEATRYLSWTTHRSIDDTRGFLQYAVGAWEFGTDYAYSIRLKNNVLIGSIGLIHDQGKVQIGYVVSPAHWNFGYSTEACRKVLDILMNFKTLYRIGTFVDADNKASIRVLEKCGMVQEAYLEKWFRFVNQDNTPKDCIFFKLIP